MLMSGISLHESGLHVPSVSVFLAVGQAKSISIMQLMGFVLRGKLSQDKKTFILPHDSCTHEVFTQIKMIHVILLNKECFTLLHVVCQCMALSSTFLFSMK